MSTFSTLNRHFVAVRQLGVKNETDCARHAKTLKGSGVCREPNKSSIKPEFQALKPRGHSPLRQFACSVRSAGSLCVFRQGWRGKARPQAIDGRLREDAAAPRSGGARPRALRGHGRGSRSGSECIEKTAFSLFGRAMATHASRAETARIPSDTRSQRDVAPVSNPILPDEGMRAHCLIAHGITTQVQLFNGSSRRDSPDAGQARISGMGTRVLDQGGSRVSGKKAPGQQAVPKTAVHCPSSWGDAHSRRRPFRSSNQWNRAGTISPDR